MRMRLWRVLCVVLPLVLNPKGALCQLNVCGQAPLNTRIVGGQDAPVGAWPWMASLQTNGRHFCGGTLINSEWVMTAAHCFGSISASRTTIVLGLQDLQGINPNSVFRGVSTLLIHPNYNSPIENDNDIALLKLSSSVSFNDYVVPVCLATESSTVNSDISSWISGWGTLSEGAGQASNTLQEAQVPVVSNTNCRFVYGITAITENMLCAGFQQGGIDSCQGDSGGPLSAQEGTQWVQLGVVSFGAGCAREGIPGVYARVSRYESWIRSQISSNQPGFLRFTSTTPSSGVASPRIFALGLSIAPVLLSLHLLS